MTIAPSAYIKNLQGIILNILSIHFIYRDVP